MICFGFRASNLYLPYYFYSFPSFWTGNRSYSYSEDNRSSYNIMESFLSFSDGGTAYRVDRNQWRECRAAATSDARTAATGATGRVYALRAVPAAANAGSGSSGDLNLAFKVALSTAKNANLEREAATLRRLTPHANVLSLLAAKKVEGDLLGLAFKRHEETLHTRLSSEPLPLKEGVPLARSSP